MTIDHERPEDEVHSARASELLTVLALIAARQPAGTSGFGSMACPVCRAGIVSYSAWIQPADSRSRHLIAARCSTPGCIAVNHSPAKEP